MDKNARTDYVQALHTIIVENTIFEFFIFNKVSNNYWNLRYNIYE